MTTYYNPYSGVETSQPTVDASTYHAASENPPIDTTGNAADMTTTDGSGAVDIMSLIDMSLNPYSYSNSTTTGKSTNNSSSSSFSGLDAATRNALMSAVMPSLTQSITELPGAIGDYTQNAVNLYNNQARQGYMETIPQVLENLGARGLSIGNLGGNVVSNAMRGINTDAANKAYEAGMTEANLRYGLPTVLGNLASLGQYSQGSSSSSGSSTNKSVANSEVFDEGNMQRALLNFLPNYQATTTP